MSDYFERDVVAKMGENFAHNLRKRRILMRQSQAWAADRMQHFYGFKWHQTMVAKVEAGDRAVRLPEAFALCRVYGIELDDMIRGRNITKIRNGQVAVHMPDGTVSVYPQSSGDPDAPLQEIGDLIKEGEEHLWRRIE